MNTKHITLNIVQDLATPHNNSLIRALRERGDMFVVTWYAMRTSSDLPWKEGLADSTDNYYYDSWPNRLKLMYRVLLHSNEKFLVVGYANFGTRFILGVSWLLKRKFIYWSDHPEDKQRSFLRSWLRTLVFRILRSCADPICVVGQRTVETFKTLGFQESRLVNLPILINLPPIADKTSPESLAERQKYGVKPNDVMFVTASRLIYQKGYDLIIEAVANIDRHHLQSFKLLIVGSGPEWSKLDALVEQYKLGENIQFEQWLAPPDYERVMAAADVFVHPARFDAFGGGTLYAMAMGVPVIASDGAGSAIERVISGENGLIYPREDVRALAHCIVHLLLNRDERRKMGLKARTTAEKWPPSRGAQIVKDAVERGQTQ